MSRPTEDDSGCSCKAPCDYEGDPELPCSGPVDLVDEIDWEDEDGTPDWSWVHACEAHARRYHQGRCA